MKLTTFTKKIVLFLISATVLPSQLSAAPSISEFKNSVVERLVNLKDIFKQNEGSRGTSRASYGSRLTPSAQKDLAFVLSLCAKSSLTALSKAEGELKAALNSLKTVHPLRVLLTVFKEESLKNDLLKIRGRTMIWKVLTSQMKENFSKGINYTDSEVKNFASALGVEAENVSNLVSKNRWADLLNTLLDGV